MKLARRADIDFTQGPFLKKIILFSIPVMLTLFLQNLYNTVDLIIVGNFRGDEALAAVGSTTSLMSMVSCIFGGLSTGAGVLTAQYIGAKDEKKIEKVVHTSVLLGAILGVIISVAFIFLTPTILRWINVPANIFDQAVLYARIIYIGYPLSLIYNYSAAIVRASGDTKHPLMFLTISGITNVILNVIMVACFGMGVDGVAIATVISNGLSAVMMLVFMNRQNTYIKFSLSKLRLDWHSTKHILLIGIPTGLQNALYNFANMMIQASVNTFGEMTVAGNTAAANLENYPYVAQCAVHQAAMTFTAQNVGAKKYKNIKRITFASLACGVGLCLIGCVLLLPLPLRSFFVGLYVSEAASIEIAYLRLFIMLIPMAICSIIEILVSELRAMKRSIAATAISIFSGVIVRLAWVKTVPLFIPKIEMVYLAFPVSNVTAFILIVPFFIYCYRKLRKEEVEERLTQ